MKSAEFKEKLMVVISGLEKIVGDTDEDWSETIGYLEEAAQALDNAHDQAEVDEKVAASKDDEEEDEE